MKCLQLVFDQKIFVVLLLDCHGFGKVSRAIDVATTQYSNVIGQQLHWNDGENALKRNEKYSPNHDFRMKRCDTLLNFQCSARFQFFFLLYLKTVNSSWYFEVFTCVAHCFFVTFFADQNWTTITSFNLK